ncbi:SulP family inorganic anion transporter [Phenylobacterium sp.]|uniref:SulP family inorganic anion transporter n=1 Tax=Phenylobacterium sp. TaxID=1871053 RepID=UPI002601BF96|nr:sulfate permease [Phenylobacterium sp.]
MALARYFPILDWGRHYGRAMAANDLLAAVIVTIMLIPQSLAYAMLAGLPPQIGLYASIAPLIAYTIFGTSRTLAVGPVAVVSLMTAAAASNVAAQGTPEYLGAAIVLALLSGALLLLLGVFRLGFLANFLSHPVISGFITASGVLIAISQLKHLLGVNAEGDTAIELGVALARSADQINLPTAVIGVAGLIFLFWVRKGLQPLLQSIGLPARPAAMIAKAGPVVVVAVSTLAVSVFGLEQAGVRTVGEIPGGLPRLALPAFEPAAWLALAGPAALMSIVGFVESVSVAQTLAAKRRQRIDPDQELVALGASNLGSAFSGGFPVTGGFARSVVNFDAGAETPAAGAYTAVGIAVATLFLTPLIRDLPNATLAATIIIAVLSLVDLNALSRTWRYSRADFAAMAATILLTLSMGVEAGIVAGVGLSLALYLYRGSKPHVAIVGQVPGTEHFRNVLRHEVQTVPGIVTLRVDESLFFANARYLEDTVYELVAEDKTIRHLVLMCSAVNEVDASALESLEAINARLKDANVSFHLSEVKGPVMDRLKRSHFLEGLTGEVYLSQHDAIAQLKARLDRERPFDPDAHRGAHI